MAHQLTVPSPMTCRKTAACCSSPRNSAKRAMPSSCAGPAAYFSTAECFGARTSMQAYNFCHRRRNRSCSISHRARLRPTPRRLRRVLSLKARIDPDLRRGGHSTHRLRSFPNRLLLWTRLQPLRALGRNTDLGASGPKGPTSKLPCRRESPSWQVGHTWDRPICRKQSETNPTFSAAVMILP
jgi:hypothetical protein